jgi:hypothetical protein
MFAYMPVAFLTLILLPLPIILLPLITNMFLNMYGVIDVPGVPIWTYIGYIAGLVLGGMLVYWRKEVGLVLDRYIRMLDIFDDMAARLGLGNDKWR